MVAAIEFDNNPKVYSNVFKVGPLRKDEFLPWLVCRVCLSFVAFAELKDRKAEDGCPRCGATTAGGG